jgi:hypothetical protein
MYTYIRLLPYLISWLNFEKLWIYTWSISSGARYVTLQKWFSHANLVIYSFATQHIKLKLGQQIGERLLIANHLDESLWWANQRHWAAVKSILCYCFGQVAFHSHHKACNYAEPNYFPDPNRHVSTFLHPILLSRITYSAPLEMQLPSLYVCI